MTFDSQWGEIFRVGDYGPKGKWTREMLAQAVTNFKAGVWKPPAVLGHPEDDSPAMAWVEELQLDGDVLKARFGQVQPELSAHVQSGRFPNRSAAFYLNPQNNGPVLRHVGFLGAMPPEVKGLAPLRFSDSNFVAIEFKMGKENSMYTLPSVNLVAAAAVLGRDISDPATVKLHERAEQIAQQRGIAFGEALRQARGSSQFYEGEVLPNGMVVVGVDLVNQINAVIREAAINGAKLTYSEAQEIVKESNELEQLTRFGTNFAEMSDT